jgi:hypothetical protein
MFMEALDVEIYEVEETPRNPFQNNGQLPNFNGIPFPFPGVTPISGTSVNGGNAGAHSPFDSNGAKIDLIAPVNSLQGMLDRSSPTLFQIPTRIQ